MITLKDFIKKLTIQSQNTSIFFYLEKELILSLYIFNGSLSNNLYSNNFINHIEITSNEINIYLSQDKLDKKALETNRKIYVSDIKEIINPHIRVLSDSFLNNYPTLPISKIKIINSNNIKLYGKS